MSDKNHNTLYKEATIVSSSKDPVQSDILVKNGVIEKIAPSIPESGDFETYDAKEKIIVPGMFDVHVHAREPGQEDKESIASCAKAAINGGITGIVLMPNTTPAIDSANHVKSVLSIAKSTSQIPVFTSGCITKDRKGEKLAGISGMKNSGVVFLTDDGDPVSNSQVLRRAMEYADGYDLFTASHCETFELTANGAMNEGESSYRLGIPGIPAASEEVCLARDILLAKETNTHVHIQHVTSKMGMELIRCFKEQGVKVTCEVTPHHLLYCDDDIVDYDTHYKMNPPLRTKDDKAGLLQGLLDGVFDMIATDHAPHTPFEKGMDFVSAPFGITGLDTAVISLYDEFISKGVFDWKLLVHRYSDTPRELIKLPTVSITEGETTDFFVFDPNKTTKFTGEYMESKSQNTPLLDHTLQGAIDRVVLGDKILLDR